MKKMGLKGLFIIAFLCLAVIGVMASTPWVAPPIDHGKLGVADTSLVRSILQITTGDPETENTKIKDWIPCWGVNPWSKDGEWIVYQSRFGVDKQDFEICIIKPDGSGYKRLTENNDCDSHGNFTADGQRIIFQRDVEGAAEIWIMNKNGSGQQSLTQKHGGPVHSGGCEQKPLVSPDGTKILFRACTGDSSDDESGELWVMNLDGSNPVKVSRDITKATKHSWSPDSAWILFSAEIYYNALDDERSRIYKVRPNGKDLTQLSDNDKDYCENWAAWSPDGKWISYHRRLKDGDGDISDLWLMRADGSGKKVLVTGTNDALDPEDEWTCGPHSWHPSAQWIAFKRYVNGCDTSIYVINVKTGQIDRLTQGYADGRMWWSPKGEHILFKEYGNSCTRDGGAFDFDLLILNMSSKFKFTGSVTVDTGSIIDDYFYANEGVTNEVHKSKSGNDHCFIATAAFGSPLAKQVQILRNFRDRYLLTNALGQKFVSWYYQNGPVAAAWIKDKPLVKAAVQAALYPLIGFSFLLLSGYMPVAALGILLSVLCFIRFRPQELSTR